MLFQLHMISGYSDYEVCLPYIKGMNELGDIYDNMQDITIIYVPNPLMNRCKGIDILILL